jgi:hypothetical protein
MLRHAVREYRSGKDVMILTDHVPYLKGLLLHLDGVERLPSVANPGRLRIESFESHVGQLDLKSMHMFGCGPECVLLIDHACLESRYGKIIEMATMFDEDVSPWPSQCHIAKRETC